MRRLILVFLGFPFIFLSCSKDSGIEPSASIANATYILGDMTTKIIGSDAFRIWVNIDTNAAHQNNIRIEANANLHEHILVIQKSETLEIKLEDNLNINGTPTLNAYVTLKELNSIKGSGASRFTLNDKIVSPYFEMDLSGASYASGQIEVSLFTSIFSGGSNASLNGMSEGFVISASGGSNFGKLNYETNHFDADLSGGSSVSITVHESLKVVASGGSSVQYTGDGNVIAQDLSGGSTITKL